MENELRKLSRSTEYQNLYNAVKECNGIQFFRNVSNFSGLQKTFLYWVSTYSMLFQELATMEDKFLTEKVIEDDIRCDAYLIYRKNKHTDFWKKHRQEEKLNEIKSRHPHQHKSGKTNLISTHFYRADQVKE